MQRYFLLVSGVTLAFIGAAYCIDPNLLLAHYELVASGASEDNMYRGAYGGLFLTIGAAIAFGFFASSFRQSATIIALLFMGGFAIGRVASIFAIGIPHPMIVGLLIFEISVSMILAWFLVGQAKQVTAN